MCGIQWQRDYTQLHKEILSGDRAPRYFIQFPWSSGPGDNIIGHMGGFLYALLNHRAYLIPERVQFHDGCEFGSYFTLLFKENSIKWILPEGGLVNTSYACVRPRKPHEEICTSDHSTIFPGDATKYSIKAWNQLGITETLSTTEFSEDAVFYLL